MSAYRTEMTKNIRKSNLSKLYTSKLGVEGELLSAKLNKALLLYENCDRCPKLRVRHPSVRARMMWLDSCGYRRETWLSFSLWLDVGSTVTWAAGRFPGWITCVLLATGLTWSVWVQDYSTGANTEQCYVSLYFLPLQRAWWHARKGEHCLPKVRPSYTTFGVKVGLFVGVIHHFVLKHSVNGA